MKEQTTMQLEMIGLGRMGGNMARRLLKNGHKCVVFVGFGGHLEKQQPKAA